MLPGNCPCFGSILPKSLVLAPWHDSLTSHGSLIAAGSVAYLKKGSLVDTFVAWTEPAMTVTPSQVDGTGCIGHGVTGHGYGIMVGCWVRYHVGTAVRYHCSIHGGATVRYMLAPMSGTCRVLQHGYHYPVYSAGTIIRFTARVHLSGLHHGYYNAGTIIRFSGEPRNAIFYNFRKPRSLSSR